jgi:CRISPR system Cascade subunit CasB
MTITEKLQRETDFLKSLHKRIENDNGAKAAFKRALSGESNHLRHIYAFVLLYLGGVSEWKQNYIWIPIACLSVYYPQPIREKIHDFGYSCWKLNQGSNSKGTERRFKALLDTDLVDIQSPLNALVRQMKSKEIPIDYPQLISDLSQWEHPNQYIQDRWARTFWGVHSDDNEQD